MNKEKKINRIGIDARFYGPIGKGLGRYTQEIVDNIIKFDQTNKYVVFLRRENFHSFNSDNFKVKKVLADIKWYGLAEQILFPFYIWRERLAIIHFPHFNVPIFCPVKFIVTIHDLILIKFPTQRATTLAPAIYRIKNFFYKIVISLAVRRARRVLAVSECTKKDIIRQFKIKPEKIMVTYEGVAQFCPPSKGGLRGLNFQSEADPPWTETSPPLLYKEGKYFVGCDAKPEDILRKYNIIKPYLLYVGNAYPHKNLEGLIRVFAQINKNFPDLKLVLVGKEDYFYRRLKKLAVNLAGAIIFSGYVPDADLKILYQNGLAYVFPSFYEGFGLPALEAMAFGLPVVSSDKTSLPEILGAAAVYFNPENEAEMKEKIELAIKDENLRQELISRGLEQVKKYSWSDCARKTLEVYNEVLNK